MKIFYNIYFLFSIMLFIKLCYNIKVSYKKRWLVKVNLKLDLGIFNSVFVVPSSVVDDHIKLAGSVQLKVLLYILRYAGKNLSVNDIAGALSLSCADVKDAMQYWLENNLINNLPINNDIKNSNYTDRKEAEIKNNSEASNVVSIRKKVVSM